MSINYFGDGASQIGSVLESMNLAAAWKVPVAYFIENNLYAVSTHASEVTADPRFSVRGQASPSLPGGSTVWIRSRSISPCPKQ